MEGGLSQSTKESLTILDSNRPNGANTLETIYAVVRIKLMNSPFLHVRGCELGQIDLRRKIIEKEVVNGADKTSASNEQSKSSCESHG
jgi:hypothetical protein